MSGGPLIVQSDKTLLLEVDHPDALACRMAIAPFAELERSPEHVHTYRLTPLGLWNARAAGHDAEGVVDALLRSPATRCRTRCWSTWPRRWTGTAGCSWSTTRTHGLVLRALDRMVLIEVAKSKKLAGMLGDKIDDDTIAVHPSERGRLKQALLKLGWPAEDLAGYVDGEAHDDRSCDGRTGWDAAVVPAGGGRALLGRRVGRGGAALRRRQDAGRRGRDGARRRRPR